MTYQQIKSFINTYIVQNGVNAITGAQLNTILNELADYKGFDSVVVTTLPAGSDATATVQGMTLVLGIPKGADGRDGQDGIDGQNAVNPFKGWFTTDNIPTTGQAGDYCNVSNTSVTPHTVTIYRWSTANNRFEDTGEVPDTAMGETFASSETLQEVAIDDSHLVNPVNTADATQPVLAKADDVMQLKAKLEGVTASEEKVQLVTSNEGQNVFAGKVVGATGDIDHSGSNDANYKYVEFEIPSNVKSIRFMTPSGTGWSAGWAIGHYSEGDFVKDRSSEYVSGREFTVEVKEGETHFRTNCYMMYGTPQTDRLLGFYCYLQSGESVGEELETKVNRADLSEYEHVVKNLFDKSSFKRGYYVINLDDGEVANSTGIMSQPLYLNSGTPYIISKIIIGGTGTNRNAKLCVYDSNDTLINVKSLPGTVVHEYSASSYYKYEGIVNFVHEQIDNEAYCRIVIQYNANLSATTNYAQLEVGIGEPTEYSEYNSVYGYDFGKGSEVDARIEALEEQVSSNSKEIENFNTIEEGLKYAEGTSIVNSDLEINSAYYYGAVGTTIKTKSALSSFHGKRYIVEGGETYYFSNKFNAGVYSGATPIYGLIFTDSNGSVIARYFLATKNLDEWKDFSIIAPDNAEYAYVNYHSSSVSYTDFLKEIQYGYIDVLGIKEDVDSLKEGSGNTNRSLMKVIIDDNSFVVRTKFSDTEDFAIKFDERILRGSGKYSQSLTLNSYYLGLNTLSDSQLVSSDNKFDNNPDDTISAIAFNGFSAMTGQHGWSIVRVTKTDNILVDSNDIGSIWADKAKPNRTFVLGYITDNYVYFFPEITYNEGTGIYGTTTGNVSANVPNSFIYVSGEAVHKEEINGTTNRYDLRVETTEWSYLVDGHKVGKGTYYCDDFIFTEKVKGHNPAGVAYSDWFTNDDDDRYTNQDFVYLCRSFVFKGSSMTYNLSFNTLYPFELSHFYFLHPLLPIAHTENGKTYHANLFVPKCKGISTPYTNDSGTESGKSYTKYRRSEDLYNVNDLPDRAIAFLQAGENDYNIGMAGGYSLINGCTQKSIRNELLNGLLDNTTTHICQFGNGSSSKNKFYTYALVSSYFEGSIVPTSFVRDFSGYICWFNPNYNPGLQVYTYKDSDCYVVYIHAQSPNDKVAVNLPDYLEGMSVIDTVEKTNGSTLLTDKVSCEKIYVKFEANNGTTYSVNDNYIVLKVR